VSEQQRLVEALNRVTNENHSTLDAMKARYDIIPYQLRLLEAMLLLQLDARDTMLGLKKERDEAIEAQRKEEDRLMNIHLPPNIIYKPRIAGLDDLTEAAAPPDPRAVWPNHDVRRFTLTISVPEAAFQGSALDWTALVQGGMHHVTQHITESVDAQEFATNYGDLEVIMHAQTELLPVSGAASDTESHVEPSECSARVVKMALEEVRKAMVPGDARGCYERLEKACKLLEEVCRHDPVAAFEDNLEYAYWQFDHYHKHRDGDLPLLSERDAFKRAVREMKGQVMTLADLDRVVDKAHAAGLKPLPIDWDAARRAFPYTRQQTPEEMAPHNHPAGGWRHDCQGCMAAASDTTKSGDQMLGEDKAAMKREAAERYNEAKDEFVANVEVADRPWSKDRSLVLTIVVPDAGDDLLQRFIVAALQGYLHLLELGTLGRLADEDVTFSHEGKDVHLHAHASGFAVLTTNEMPIEIPVPGKEPLLKNLMPRPNDFADGQALAMHSNDQDAQADYKRRRLEEIAKSLNDRWEAARRIYQLEQRGAS
jgi:hypothetical protein